MFRDKPLGNLTDKNVEGAEAGTKVSLQFCLSRANIKYSLVKNMSCYLIVNPHLRRKILFLISFLLDIALAASSSREVSE